MTKKDEQPDLPDIEDDLDDEENDDALDDDLEDDNDEGDNEDGSEDDGEDADDEPLGEKGTKALARMKATVKDLKKTIRDLKSDLDEARNGSDEEEDELTASKKETERERTKRIEAEKKLAAKIHGLPESWADRLKGDDFDDFLDDAEALAEDIPTPPTRRKGGGGAKDGNGKRRKPPSLDDQIAEAEKTGDHATARRLKAQKVHDLRANA